MIKKAFNYDAMRIDLSMYKGKTLRSGIELMRLITSHTNSEGVPYEAYIVGGSVRDLILEALLGKPSKIYDIDIATNMPISELQKAFRCESNNGEAHGTILVQHKNDWFEVTQFRTEQGYTDGRHPDHISLTNSFKEDTDRRDFTINAMGIDRDGNIIDYHDGIHDLMVGYIRTVGNPDDRFSEDGLRIIRAMRFAARFTMGIDDDTKDSIIKNVSMLEKISIDRIYAEFQKCAQYGATAFADFVSLFHSCDAHLHVSQCAMISRSTLIRIRNRAIADHAGMFPELHYDDITAMALLFIDSECIDKAMHDFRCTVDMIRTTKWIASSIEKIKSGDMDLITRVEMASNPNITRLRAVYHSIMEKDIPFADMVETYCKVQDMVPRTTITRAVMASSIKPGPEFGAAVSKTLNWTYERVLHGVIPSYDDICDYLNNTST